MFRGVVPQVDALEKLRRAERVNLDWLISGEGQPFVIPVYRDDAAAAEALGEKLADGSAYLLTVLAGRAEAAVVLTLPVVVEYDETEGSFIDVQVFQPAGPRTLAVAADWQDRQVAPVGSDTLASLRGGWLGPRDLLGDDGLLAQAQPAAAAEVCRVAEETAAYQAAPDEEAQILGHFRHLTPRQRAAVLEVVQGLDRSVSVGQAPPGGVVNPDETRERQAVPSRPAPQKVD